MLAAAVRPHPSLSQSHACHTCNSRNETVCGALHDDELAKLRRLGNSFQLARSRPLFHEGDQASRVFTVTRGSLKLYKLLPDGRRQVMGFMQAGDFVGVSVNDEYAFTAEALEETQLCAFSRNGFYDFVEHHPEMERELYRLATHELAAAQQQMVLLGRKTAPERLASFFLLLIKRAERSTGERARFVHLSMSRSDIADYLGLTKETVSRVLALLKSKRLIRLEALDRIEILDLAGLEGAAEGGPGK